VGPFRVKEKAALFGWENQAGLEKYCPLQKTSMFRSIEREHTTKGEGGREDIGDNDTVTSGGTSLSRKGISVQEKERQMERPRPGSKKTREKRSSHRRKFASRQESMPKHFLQRAGL